MGLPDMDGQTLVSILRDSPSRAHPIVALTAWPENIAEEMAARYGCDGCITKPLTLPNSPGKLHHS